jgi:hypothetical protein
MDSSYKTYVKTDLASLHFVIFIEPLAVCPTEALSFNSDQFTNNTINKVIEEKNYDSFMLHKEHYFADFWVYKKPYEFDFKDLSHEVLQFFLESYS